MPANQAKSVTLKRFTGGVEAVLDTPIFFATLSMTSLNSDRLGDRTSMCCFAGSLYVCAAFREQLTTSSHKLVGRRSKSGQAFLFRSLYCIYAISRSKPYIDFKKCNNFLRRKRELPLFVKK
jgi:hypothetical protein